jgi:hypothetical protein
MKTRKSTIASQSKTIPNRIFLPQFYVNSKRPIREHEKHSNEDKNIDSNKNISIGFLHGLLNIFKNK